jgi:hypothetical protein
LAPALKLSIQSANSWSDASTRKPLISRNVSNCDKSRALVAVDELLTLGDRVSKCSGLMCEVGVLVVSVGSRARERTLQPAAVAELIRCLSRTRANDESMQIQDVL